MKALSVRQPWAWLIMFGYPVLDKVPTGDGLFRLEWHNKVRRKDIENRSWPLPPDMMGQRIYIHAGARWDTQALNALFEIGVPPGIALMCHSRAIPTGALLGTVELGQCITESKSPWFTGPYGFEVKNPEPLDKPIPYKGRLGFFEVALP